MIKVKAGPKRRVCQGDLYKNIEFIERISEVKGEVEISKIVFPYVIVLTQDCDLEQFHKGILSKKESPNYDKWLISVIVAPLYNVDHVYQGEHLSDIGLEMQKINKNKTPGSNLRNNETPRYHYLEFPPNFPLVNSVIDFKHYFSVNVDYLRKKKKTNFLGKVSELYREDISQRFASYLSRIGLP